MKLFYSERAEAEVIGHIIILAITILGIGMITLFGVPAIYNLEDMANSKNVEQAFTVLDSRASRVTLGDSPLQVTNIEPGGGTVTVEPNSSRNPSYIVINSSDFNFTIPMGRIKYTLEDRIVSYEGGGVWAQYPDGGTVMLSPPEFHYNGWTLTLPVINVSGNASFAGEGTTVVSIKKITPIIKYPNASSGMVNPVNGSKNGKVNVNIKSDYYKSWADYARTLSYTNVSVDDRNKTAIIVLEVLSPMGTFSLPAGEITMRNINTSNPTPVNNFSVNLFDSQMNKLNNMDWEIYAINGTNKLELDVEKDGNNFMIKIEFNSSSGEEEWKGCLLCGGVSSWPNSINVDFLNKSMNLTTSDTLNTWPGSGNSRSVYDIFQHYLTFMGSDVTFITDESRKVDYSKSQLTLNYDPGPGALTYLHVTENRADVVIS
ncbi:MAG: hypothetical protein FIB07_00990 [Candidatus Methanoperedens sp.]|nr:hypothetical protein [Candidatus Methanoperedens sp.]